VESARSQNITVNCRRSASRATRAAGGASLSTSCPAPAALPSTAAVGPLSGVVSASSGVSTVGPFDGGREAVTRGGRGGDSSRPDGRGVGARGLAWHGPCRGRRGLDLTGPDQDLPLFIDGQSSQGEFFPDLLQQRLVEAKDICEGAIRDPPLMPQQADYRWEHGVETHLRPSPWSLWLDGASGCRLCGKWGGTVIAEGCR
jgi:hypothetical protein